MARYAVISSATDIVDNIVEWDGNLQTWSPDPGFYTVETDDARRGDHYVDGVFVHPPHEEIPVPPRFDRLVIKLVEKEIIDQEEADAILTE